MHHGTGILQEGFTSKIMKTCSSSLKADNEQAPNLSSNYMNWSFHSSNPYRKKKLSCVVIFLQSAFIQRKAHGFLVNVVIIYIG